jgi:hypothetical protein
MSELPEIEHLNFKELEQLRECIDTRMTQMRQEGAPKLAERFADEVAAHGLTFEDVVRAARKRKRYKEPEPEQDAGST